MKKNISDDLKVIKNFIEDLERQLKFLKLHLDNIQGRDNIIPFNPSKE